MSGSEMFHMRNTGESADPRFGPGKAGEDPKSSAVAAPPGRPLVLAAAMLGIFMAAVESTIVATAMPTIVADLGGFSLFSWVFAAYLLAQAVTIPIYGRLADLYGRKRVFFAGASLFLAASVLCGLARGMVPLILFRAVQGAGAGALQPIATTIVGDIYTPAERARVQGYLSGVFGVAALIGPPLGGFLVEHASWSFVFWINLPIGAAAFAMLGLCFRERVQRRPHRIDYAGSALLTFGAGTLMLALLQASEIGAAAAALALAGGLGLLALIAHESRTPEPIFPLTIWRHRVIALGNLGGFTNGALTMAISGFLPTYLQGAMGSSPTVAGMASAASSVSWALAAAAAGRLIVRRSYRASAVLGGFWLIAGMLMLITLEPQRSVSWAAAGALLIGVGMGFTTTAFVVSIQASVGWSERGAATSSFMFMRIVGQSMGAALFGAVLDFDLARHGADVGAIRRLMEPALRHALGAAELARLVAAIAGALHLVYVIAGLLAAATLAFAFCLPAALRPAEHRSAPERRDAGAAEGLPAMPATPPGASRD
jgi:EmrB/QacA subfamily drug resistance transporter